MKMRLRNLLIVLSVTLLSFASSVYAASPVWKITKGDNHLFIGGTIHVLTKADFPLPTAFETAYSQSSRIIFETDMQGMKNPEIQKRLLKQVMYADGKNLKQELDKQTFMDLEKHLTSRGIPVANLLPFKPGMLAVTLTVIELHRLGLAGTGVDEFYSLKALNDNKPLGQLESIDAQIGFLASMGDGQENELIASTLREIKEIPAMLQATKEAWRKSDGKKLVDMSLVPMKKESPAVYDTLIVKRNNAWMVQIEEMLKTKEVEFVLVGALHLFGDDGVIARLSAKGYTVQMLD
jgi:uncharacterized protein